MKAKIKNLDKAALRIRKAVKNGEKIILYGDADLDGIGSVLIAKETIKSIGGEISSIYFPDRETEGYGINETALKNLEKYSPALFVSMDCGIGNFDEIKIAKKMGFDVVIIDHHKVLGKVPPGAIVVDPKQEGDNYPFKEFATVGIAFKLAEEILKDRMTNFMRNNFLEIVALATIADMMIQEDENEIFIEKGLESLKNTFRPGLKVFSEMHVPQSQKEENFNQMVRTIISTCHAGDTKDHVNEGYFLLTAVSVQEAKLIVDSLLEKGRLRQLRIKEVADLIRDRVSRKPEEPIIFEGEKGWEVLILGPVASRLCSDYKKPIFLYSVREKDAQGAVRTPHGQDSVKAMMSCAQIIDNYGGHAQAAGFRIKNEKLEEFKKCLIRYFEGLAG